MADLDGENNTTFDVNMLRQADRSSPGLITVSSPRTTTVERIETDEDVIRMAWYDGIDPFVINAPPGTGGRPIGVLTTFFPARSAQLSMNGRFASGKPWAEMRGERQSSSCVLAWSETWVKPRD